MFKQLNTEKLIVGYDLGDVYSQISYYAAGSEGIETLSLVAGAQNYNIPTVLCKRSGVNQWFFGKEAVRYSEENEGILIENLLSLAVNGEEVQIEGEGFDPEALLALFFKRSLGMLSQVASPDKLSALMITCETLNHRVMEVLSSVVAAVRLKTDKILFQSHTESFYHYMIQQPKELWQAKTLLFEYQRDYMRIYHMECNERTTPMVVYINEEEIPFEAFGSAYQADERQEEKLERLDEEFLRVAEDACRSSAVSSVYLIGENYNEEWMKKSLRFLCKGRRVFQGNNLFSKGACHGMMERLQASETGKAHVFLGNDKLRSNVGMKILRRGKESYCALLDAGINWFEAERILELYVQEGNAIELIITSLTGQGSKEVKITLEELKGTLSRLKLRLYVQEENKLIAEIEDLGLGEFREATHHVWREEIRLYES